MKHSIQFSFLHVNHNWITLEHKNPSEMGGFISQVSVAGGKLSDIHNVVHPVVLRPTSCTHNAMLPLWISCHFMTFQQEAILNYADIILQWQSQIEMYTNGTQGSPFCGSIFYMLIIKAKNLPWSLSYEDKIFLLQHDYMEKLDSYHTCNVLNVRDSNRIKLTKRKINPSIVSGPFLDENYFLTTLLATFPKVLKHPCKIKDVLHRTLGHSIYVIPRRLLCLSTIYTIDTIQFLVLVSLAL